MEKWMGPQMEWKIGLKANQVVTDEASTVSD